MQGRSREQVTETLRTLRDAYSDFAVQQTSVGLSGEAYDRAASGAPVTATVRIRNDDGELLVATGDGDPETEPTVRFDPRDAPADRLRDELAASIGVDCRVEELLDVAIVTVHHEDDDDRPPIYQLQARFLGRYEDGASQNAHVGWRDEAEVATASY